MIETLQYSAGVMFWALINLALAVVWAGVIAGLIWKMFFRRDDD